MGESRLQRKRTISQSKVPIDETIHQLLEIYHGVKTCAFQEYNKYNQGQNQKDLIYDISFRFFCCSLHEKRCSKCSHFKVGSSLSLSNLDVSGIIS